MVVCESNHVCVFLTSGDGEAPPLPLTEPCAGHSRAQPAVRSTGQLSAAGDAGSDGLLRTPSLHSLVCESSEAVWLAQATNPEAQIASDR